MCRSRTTAVWLGYTAEVWCTRVYVFRSVQREGREPGEASLSHLCVELIEGSWSSYSSVSRISGEHELQIVQDDVLDIVGVDSVVHGIQNLIDISPAVESQEAKRKRLESVRHG